MRRFPPVKPTPTKNIYQNGDRYQLNLKILENTPKLETDRLLLRPFTEKDLPDFFLIMSDQEANRFLPWFPLETYEQARDFLMQNYLSRYHLPFSYHYAICLQSDNLPIGYLNISEDDSHDLGYGLRKEFWGQGIAAEACKAVVHRLKEAGFPYITATHDIKNPGSGKIMKKIGMSYQYSYEEDWQPKNQLVTFRMYQLNLDGNPTRVYLKYWNEHPNHFIENISV